jgi:ABC-type nitrate/sulfonate/bicarbonate transport system substrate-binding protein
MVAFGIRSLAAAALAAIGLSATAEAAEPTKVRLDYAYYNPVGLVMKEQGWVEQEFAKDGIAVEWVLSQGSNKALEFLNGSSIDFGSTAGAAALLARPTAIRSRRSTSTRGRNGPRSSRARIRRSRRSTTSRASASP